MKKLVDYILYAILIIVFIFAIILLFKKDEEVIVNPGGEVEELVLLTPSITVKVGETDKISAAVNGNNNVVFSYISTNTDVVMVSADGMVKGISEGISYVMVTYQTQKGDNLTKQCLVNVVANEDLIIEDITLDNGDIVLKVGDTYKLNYQITPNSNVSKIAFLSTDESIATISDDGVITGIKEGIVAVRIVVNNLKTADKLVYVTDKDVKTGLTTFPSSITFKSNKISLEVDEESEIKYTMVPEDANKDYFFWESSDTSIVTVLDGKIKGISEGETDINFETVNGIKTTLKVTVKAKVIPVTDIKITSEEKVSIAKGKTSQITYAILPEDATDKELTFKSSADNIVTVDEKGLITAVSSGNATITITSSSKQISKTISVTVPSSGGSSGGGSNTSGNPGGRTCKLSDDPMDSEYNSCINKSHQLIVSTTNVTVGVGSSVTVHVTLPNCGTFMKYTRRSPGGTWVEGDCYRGMCYVWQEYVSQSYSNETSSGYDWIITGKKKGSTQVSQTVQFDAESPSGKCSANMKSMKTINVTVR